MPFLEQLRAGADLVMGNRFAGGIEPGAMPWKNRHIGNPVLSGVGRFLFKCPARDFCGIRGFSVDAFRRMDLRTTGMEFASEMVIKATLLEMRVVEVPTTLERRAFEAAAPSAVARRLAPPAIHAALQPQLAVPLSRRCARAGRTGGRPLAAPGVGSAASSSTCTRCSTGRWRS